MTMAISLSNEILNYLRSPNTLPGVGFSRPEWNDIKDMKSGTVSRTIMDDTMPSGPRERTITYTAPFDKCDREADYATAWTAFEKRGKAKE